MNNKILSPKKDFWLWAIPLMIIFALVALAPQFELWMTRGDQWKGVYAINESDEPAYATYLQSILEGKPRRNTPYSGRIDTKEKPQQESLFSIQFFSTYPIAIIAKIFGLNVSEAMILLSIIAGGLSALAVFWLIYLFSESPPLSFVATIFVLFNGAIVAGQGFIISFLQGGNTNYYLTTMFLRRTNPAVSFPILFFFFISVWYFFKAETNRQKIISGFLSTSCFAATVYSYFFHWTTAFAWFGGFLVLFTILRFQDFRKNLLPIAGLCIGLFATLIPYFILLSNRAANMDSAQLLVLTRMPDLWRAPAIISYLTFAILVLAHKKEFINLRENRYLFLLSLTLVSPLVFNQQVLTGRSLQPFHYEFFAANYISLTAGITVLFLFLAMKLKSITFQKTIMVIAIASMVFGYFDILFSVSLYHKQNNWRDEMLPVAQRIKEIAKTSNLDKPVILATDLSHYTYFTGTDLPTFTSQPILWSPHLSMFPDIDSEENLQRFMDFLYYQNLDGEMVRNQIINENNGILIFGFFGPGRSLSFLTAEYKPISPQEIENAVSKFSNFQTNYGFKDAQKTPISFIVVRNDDNFNFSRIDQWYQRDEGEVLGDYTYYRVTLKPGEN